MTSDSGTIRSLCGRTVLKIIAADRSAKFTNLLA